MLLLLLLLMLYLGSLLSRGRYTKLGHRRHVHTDKNLKFARKPHQKNKLTESQ